MNTKTAKIEAKRRTKILKKFFSRFKKRNLILVYKKATSLWIQSGYSYLFSPNTKIGSRILLFLQQLPVLSKYFLFYPQEQLDEKPLQSIHSKHQ